MDHSLRVVHVLDHGLLLADGCAGEGGSVDLPDGCGRSCRFVGHGTLGTVGCLVGIDGGGGPSCSVGDFCGFSTLLGYTFAAYAVRPRAWMAAVAFAAARARISPAWSLRQAGGALIVCGVFYTAHTGAPARHGRGRVDIS